MSGFSEVQDFAEIAWRAREPHDILNAFARIANGFGHPYWYIGALVHETQLSANHFGYLGLREDWRLRYAEQNYVVVDPVTITTLRRFAPFTWTEAITGFGPLSRRQTNLFHEARDAGIENGFVVPMRATGQPAGCVAFQGGPDARVDSEARGALVLLGMYAYEGLARFLPHANHPPRLTARERDILRWTAEGKTAWEVGTILGISEGVVRAHLASLKRKYRVATPIQAAVRAAWDGTLVWQSPEEPPLRLQAGPLFRTAAGQWEPRAD